MHALDEALDLTVSTPGVHDGRLDGGWLIGHALNGGVLLSVLGQAFRQRLGGLDQGHGDPLAVTGYFVSAAEPGDVRVTTEVVREGRTMATGQASLLQPDGAGGWVERVRALATYGDLGNHADDVRTSATPPEMPPPERCVGTDLAPADSPWAQIPFLGRVEVRFDPDTVGWALGAPSGRGVLQAWIRMADGREPDPLMLLLAVDALPPVTFDLGLLGWAPTLELTAHVRAVPAPGWLALRATSRNLAGGLVEEDVDVWDSAGRLVAQSRQLARAPRPTRVLE